MLKISRKQFPILKEEYALHKGLNFSFVYQNRKIGIKSSESIVVNEDAARIINECDGKNSIDQIVRKLSSKYDENLDELDKVVKSFILTNNYFDIFDKPITRKTKKTGSWEVQIPRHVSIELTNHCNFKCKHCYKKSTPKKNQIIDKNWLIHILDDLKCLGIDSIELTGGEPLTHPKFIQILKHAFELFSLVSVITNGYLLTEDLVNIFSNYKDKLMLQISLYGCEPSYVDWFADKRGAFKRSKQSIKTAASKGLFVISSMIVTPYNIDKLFSTVQLAKKLGVSTFRVSTVVPLGRADMDQLHFSPENIELLINEIRIVKETFGNFIFETPEYLLKTSTEMSNCGAGTKTITITPNGNVKICPLATTPQLYLGNLHLENINSLLKQNKELNLFEIKDPRNEICGNCDNLWFCEGCLARGSQKYAEIGERCYWGENYFNKFFEPLKEAK